MRNTVTHIKIKLFINKQMNKEKNKNKRIAIVKLTLKKHIVELNSS